MKSGYLNPDCRLSTYRNVAMSGQLPRPNYSINSTEVETVVVLNNQVLASCCFWFWVAGTTCYWYGCSKL